MSLRPVSLQQPPPQQPALPPPLYPQQQQFQGQPPCQQQEQQQPLPAQQHQGAKRKLRIGSGAAGGHPAAPQAATDKETNNAACYHQSNRGIRDTRIDDPGGWHRSVVTACGSPDPDICSAARRLEATLKDE